ncbi:MAG TPA: hypothetical protein VFR81_11620 [Longimicrobium sp.]|nr:hypothetical protein [Longimicrobium sp.]
MFNAGPPWVVVASYGTVFEAEFAAATLTEAGIPARVTGAHLGIWGAGYQGPSMYGVQLTVPWHREDDARALLETLEDDGDAPDPPEETT